MNTRGTPTPGLDPRQIRWIRIRTALLGVAFVPAVVALGVRAVKLQALQSGQMHQMAEEQYRDEEAIPPRRGTIFDRNGSPLAASVDVDSVSADPQELRGSPRLGALAQALGVDYRELTRKLDHPGHFAWLKRGATPEEVTSVKALALDGITFVKEPRRFYPQRSLSSNVLGLASVDGEGIEGLELAYDAQLRGKKGAIDVIRDAQRRTVFADGLTDTSSMAGASITLTLDRSIQHVTEVALAEAAEKTQCAGAIAIVMAPDTGEILALADWPTFNPNDPVTSEKALRNRAVMDAFEPGSTMKSMMMAAALEEKVVHPNDPIFCENGHYSIGSRTIHDHEPIGTISATGVITHSSNIGAAKIAERLGADRLNAYYRLFGFGEKTGAGLPGEVKGSVPFPRAAIQLATQAFGQGMTANALQMVAAYGAIANGGTLMRPYLVKKVVDSDGSILETHGPEPVRQVVSAKTAAAVTAMLQTVVTKEGTAPAAAMAEYPVAGKTGTAQKVDPDSGGYSADLRTASFIGFVPADKPRLVIAVIIDEPKGDKYGGKVAAPAFKEIALGALPLMGVPSLRGPTLTSLALAPRPGTAGAAPVMLAAASPPADEAEDGISDDGAGRAPGQSVVPDFTGMGARSAARTAAAADLQPEMEGSGRVVGQTPRPGTVIPTRSRVSIRLESRL